MIYIQLILAQILLREIRRCLVTEGLQNCGIKTNFLKLSKADSSKSVEAESEKLVIHPLTKRINTVAGFPCADASAFIRAGMQNSLFSPQCLHL